MDTEHGVVVAPGALKFPDVVPLVMHTDDGKTVVVGSARVFQDEHGIWVHGSIRDTQCVNNFGFDLGLDSTPRAAEKYEFIS